MTTKRQCSVLVVDGRFTGDCQRDATIERDGAWYCWQHDPERVAREEAKQKAALDANLIVQQASWRRNCAMEEACAGVPTEVLERISVADLLEQAE